jgi:hypothetical protein
MPPKRERDWYTDSDSEDTTESEYSTQEQELTIKHEEEHEEEHEEKQEEDTQPFVFNSLDALPISVMLRDDSIPPLEIIEQNYINMMRQNLYPSINTLVDNLFLNILQDPTNSPFPNINLTHGDREQLNLILHNNIERYSSTEYEEALSEYKKMTESEIALQRLPPLQLLNIMLDYYFEHELEWPTKEQIVQSIFDQDELILQQYDRGDIDEMLYYYVFSQAVIPLVSSVEHILEYYHLMNVFPNEEQLSLYVYNNHRFNVNPEEYHANDKIHVPVLNVEQLPITIHGGESIPCSLCQCDIVEGEEKVEIQPCGHLFHAREKNCLEEASIFKWFETESLCPLCKVKVVPSK